MTYFACVPPCKKCRESGCVKQWAKPVQQDWRPDRLALKKLQCGHRAPEIPLVLGRVSATHVMCPDGCGWQPLSFPDPEPAGTEPDTPMF